MPINIFHQRLRIAVKKIMMQINIGLLLIVSLNCIWGCMSFHYPPVEKELFSWRIPKSQIDVMKSTILNEGYKRISRDNYPYEGAIVTQYAKEISTPAIKSRIQIMLNFKEVGAFVDYYRNMGITISNLDRNDIPEINNEVARIEEIIYGKLLEVAGKDNVVRGKR